MSPVTHFLSGWALANCARLDRRDRVLVTLACVLPDIDGLGIIPEMLTRHSPHPLMWFAEYHHSLHTLAFGIVVTVIAACIATRKWKAASLAFLSFHLHLLEDIVGSRGPEGYQWPIPYLAPFSHNLQLSWSGEWALNAWQNIVITALLLTITIWFAWRRGFSPVEMVSVKADKIFVSALHQRFPIQAVNSPEK